MTKASCLSSPVPFLLRLGKEHKKSLKLLDMSRYHLMLQDIIICQAGTDHLLSKVRKLRIPFNM